MLIPRSNVVAVSPAAGVVKDGVSLSQRRIVDTEPPQTHRSTRLTILTRFDALVMS